MKNLTNVHIVAKNSLKRKILEFTSAPTQEKCLTYVPYVCAIMEEMSNVTDMPKLEMHRSSAQFVKNGSVKRPISKNTSGLAIV